MGFLNKNFAPFLNALEGVDAELQKHRPFDAKTDELLRFALSIKARSAPCVRKHFKGATAAGATDAEIAYVFALTMREAAGADDCWAHSVISEVASAGECGCDSDSEPEEALAGGCC